MYSGDEILDQDFDYFQDDEFVELRTILDEPLGRSHFLAHISHYKPGEADLVKLWLLLHSYHHNEQGADERYQLCKSLYKHYFYISREQKKIAEDSRQEWAEPQTIPEDETSVDKTSTQEAAFAKYRQLLVPEICRGFEERVIATIIKLRPRVETALWEGRPTANSLSPTAGSSDSPRGRSTSKDSLRLTPTTRRFSSSIDFFVDIGAPGGIVDISPHGGIGVNDNILPKASGSPGAISSGSMSPLPPSALGPSTTKPRSMSNGSLASQGSNSNLLGDAFEQAKLNGPGTDLFLTLQNEVFKEMRPLYHHFKETSDDYKAYQKSKKLKYNRVIPDDFRYLKSLGKGGFGQVVHVIKKSTGAHYAMKIQAKDTLVETWNGKMQHVEIERDVLVAHRSFPFIVSLRYAFQNDNWAFLCLDLAEHGSLRSVLENLPGYQMQVPQVRLYVAEIVLALECLHDHGIIYRDLKPENVLLFADGHVMLADMGLAGFYYQDKYHDDENQELDPCSSSGQLGNAQALLLGAAHGCAAASDSETASNDQVGINIPGIVKEMEDEDDDLFEEPASTTTVVSSQTNDGNSSSASLNSGGADSEEKAKLDKDKYQNRKSRTIQSHNTDCGTTLYRPPEMVRHEHYNEGVDFFMLGVFIYECLCATLPWMPKMDEDGEIAIDTEEDELKVFRKRLRIPSHLGESTTDLISGLLDLDPERRMGVGPPELKRDIDSLKAHPFFVPLGGPLAIECDWERVLDRGYKPVVVPGEKELDTHAQYKDFTTLVKSWKKTARKEAKDEAKKKGVKPNYCEIAGVLDPALEHYFDNWDYTDPISILAEKEIETSRSSSKIESRKSLGSRFHKKMPFHKNV